MTGLQPATVLVILVPGVGYDPGTVPVPSSGFCTSPSHAPFPEWDPTISDCRLDQTKTPSSCECVWQVLRLISAQPLFQPYQNDGSSRHAKEISAKTPFKSHTCCCVFRSKFNVFPGYLFCPWGSGSLGVANKRILVCSARPPTPAPTVPKGDLLLLIVESYLAERSETDGGAVEAVQSSDGTHDPLATP